MNVAYLLLKKIKKHTGAWVSWKCSVAQIFGIISPTTLQRSKFCTQWPWCKSKFEAGTSLPIH